MRFVYITVLFALAAQAQTREVRAGLLAFASEGRFKIACPLESAEARVRIHGVVAETELTQTYSNPFDRPIEAVYVFPMSDQGAVTEMVMRTNGRVIRATVYDKERARQLYDQAKREGKLAAKLDEQQPNVFTQRIANIGALDKVEITIRYFETVEYEDGQYEYVLPTVVGPRYDPGHKVEQPRSSPAPKPTRLSISAEIEAGVSLIDAHSPTHNIQFTRTGSTSGNVQLYDGPTRLNQDFILRYRVGAKGLEDAALTHFDGEGGYFALILQPPKAPPAEDVLPKELIFVLDTSGSMRGVPLRTAKQTMRLALNGLYARDRFNVVTFAGHTQVLFEQPVEATASNLRTAEAFLTSRQGGGGTEMMKAIRAALAGSGSAERTRIVCFMTDGFVGDSLSIIREIRRHPSARVFSFGIGSSVNRDLLSGMAYEGRGAVEYVGLSDDLDRAARRFHQRVRSPLLTDIELDWAGLPVADIYPSRIPDLFSNQPVVVLGRMTRPASGVVRLAGRNAAGRFERTIPVVLSRQSPPRRALAGMWARARVNDLMTGGDLARPDAVADAFARQEVTRLGVKHQLLTPYTSFVAVDEGSVRSGGRPMPVAVPVEQPAGMRGTIAGVVGGVPGGSAGGQIGGVLGGIVTNTPNVAAPPPPPPVRKAPPPPPKRIRVSGAVQKARLLYQVAPEYPPLARQARISGTVRLKAVIGKDGLVHSLEVLQGHPLLVPAALSAVKQWRYKPTLLNGQPVEVVLDIEVPFGRASQDRRKLSPALREAFQQVQASSLEFRLLRVRVTLDALTPEARERLEREGLVVGDDRLSATGRIALEAAHRLAELEEVKQIRLASE